METRKERTKRKERQDRARREWPGEYLSASPEETRLIGLDDIANNAPDGVLLFGRTSSRNGKDQKLDGQVEEAIQRIEQAGIRIAATFSVQETGKANKFDERKVFKQAIAEANRLHVPIVALTPSRFLRHPRYNPTTTPNVLPTKKQWNELHKQVNVPLVVCCFPATPKEDRAILVRAGMSYTPGKKKARMEAVIRTLREQGKGYRAIASELGATHGIKISHMGVKRALQKGE